MAHVTTAAAVVLSLTILSLTIALGQGESKASPDQARVGKADRDAADVFAKEAHAWTQELTTRGETLGGLLVDVIEGKSKNGDLVRGELKLLGKWLDDKAEYFAARPSPGFIEMTAFRKVLLDYIAWERKVLATGFGEYLKIAEDGRLSRDQKWDKFMKEPRALNDEELARKQKFQASENRLYQALNRK
jgi:hypothetical protein